MIKIILFVLFGILIFGLLAGILAFRALYTFVFRLVDRFQDSYNKDSRDIIDTTPDTMKFSHDLSQRQLIASKSTELSLRNLSFAKISITSTLGDELGELSPIIRSYQRQNPIRGELIFIQNSFNDVYQMLRSRQQFVFTDKICKEILRGAKLTLLKNSYPDDFTLGLVYTGQFIKDYISNLSVVVDSLDMINNRNLAKELSELVGNMEKIHWIQVTNPNYISRHSIFLAEATSIIIQKVQLINKAIELGINNQEYNDLQDQTLMTVTGINTALGNIFNEILTPELLHANAEMEVIHSELKIKGLI